MKGVGHKQEELLVTDDEQIAKLNQLLGSRFSNRGQLMLPTFQVYEALSDNDGLQSLAKDVCRWLGYKPRSLTVRFGNTPGKAKYSLSNETVTVNKAYIDHPLVTGGILVLAVINFVMEQHHYAADDRFIEAATIETGLGLWIINAFKFRLSKREKFYHMIDGNWIQLEGLQLESFTYGQYIRQFTIFAANHRLFPEDYGRGATKYALLKLPPTPSTAKIITLPEPSTTLIHRQNANKLWIKIFLLSASAAAVVMFGVIVLSQKTKPISYEQTRDAQSLRVIKESLNDCLQQASKQQSTYDPNDLFMTRQIDATKTRCESLRNQYNDALSLYEINYPKK